MTQQNSQLIGESPAFHWLMDKVSDSAALERPLLVVGERGTGKELIANRLHFLSPRWEQVFVQVNCAAYSDALLDEALFGNTTTDGHFNRAESGTLFLDNIEAVSLRLQEKLLQTLEYGLIDPLGSPDTEEVNVRIIAATGEDLPKACHEGRFRADLLDHLTFDVITLPPLRDRKEDIFPLAQYFGRKTATALGAEKFSGFTPEALASLSEQNWRGNIRQLKSVVERSIGQAFLVDETLSLPVGTLIIDPFDSPWRLTGGQLPPETEGFPAMSPHRPAQNTTEKAIANVTEEITPPPTTFTERILAFERGLIDEAMTVSDHHQGKAADYLDLTYHQFRGLLRKHGLKK